MNNNPKKAICQGSLGPKTKKSSTSGILSVEKTGLGMIELDFDVCSVGGPGNGVE